MKTLIHTVKTKGILPVMCAARHPVSNEPVLIVRNESGYRPFTANVTVEAFNSALSVSPEEVDAMMAGSMFGWHCPAANPNRHTLATN